MNIRKSIITATVAMTMVAMVAPMTVGAATMAELQAQINALMGQLQAMQGTSTSTGSAPAVCAGVTFSRNLTVGSTGADVKCFQALMNANGYQLAASGAGSPGNETSYFGPRTLASVQRLQVAKGWAPATQVGPLTRALFNSWLTGGVVVTPGTPAQTGPVSVMLSPTTPATGGSLVNGQATADLAHFTFTGNGTVTSVSLTRTGISDQNTLTNVYLYDGNTRLTDGYSFNVDSKIVMNGLSIAVMGSKTISVRADVASAAASTAATLAVSLSGFTANGATNTANVMGNLMALVVGNLATASVGTNTVSAASVNAGTTAYTFWSAPLQVNTRAVWLKAANFRMIGSAPSDALANIKLFIDGVDTGKMATVASIQGSNYAMFDVVSAPISLATGSHTVDLRADVQKGSNRNVTVSVQQAADLMIFDPQQGVNIAITTTGSTSYTANSAGQISINTGSATVVLDPAHQAITNISGGTTGAVIAKYKVHAYGEDVKVNSLVVTPTLTTTGTTTATGTQSAVGATTVTVTSGGSGYTTAPAVTTIAGTCSVTGTATATISSGAVTAITTSGFTCGASETFTLTVAAPSFGTVGGLTNVTLYFNGGQIGTQQTWPVAQGSLTYQLGSQLIAPAGVDSWLEVRADLQSTTNVAYTAGTVGANLAVGSSNGQGQISLATLNFPTALVTGSTKTIQTGLLTVASNTAYLSQAAAPNTAGVKIGSFVMQNQSTSEAVRVTSLTVAISGTTAITNLSALRTSLTSGSGATPIQPAASNTFSVNETLAAGQSKVVDIFADSSTETGVTSIVTLTVASIGATSNVSTAGTATTGQTITFNVGTVATPTLVTSTTTTAQYVAAGNGGATGATKATYNFVSTSGSSTITELKFTVTGANTVTNVCVGSVCAAPVSGVAFLTGLALAVPNGGSGLTQDVMVSYSEVSTNGIVPAVTSAVALTHVKYTSGGTTTTITPSVSAPTMTMVGSKPTVVVNTTSNTGLNIGAENKIGEVTISADAKGNVKINELQFAVSSTNFSTMPTFTLARIADGTTTVTGSSCGQGVAAATSQTIFCEFATTGNTMASTTTITGQESNTDYDGFTITAGTSKTLNLYATFSATATAASTQSISSSLVAAGFNWDDTSYATFVADGTTASPADGTNLTGTSIYNFPSGSYSIHN